VRSESVVDVKSSCMRWSSNTRIIFFPVTSKTLRKMKFLDLDNINTGICTYKVVKRSLIILDIEYVFLDVQPIPVTYLPVWTHIPLN